MHTQNMRRASESADAHFAYAHTHTLPRDAAAATAESINATQAPVIPVSFHQGLPQDT